MIFILLLIWIVLWLIWFEVIVFCFVMEKIFFIGNSNGLFVLCFGVGIYLFIVFISFIIVVLVLGLFCNVFNVEFLIIGVLLFGKLYLFNNLWIFIFIKLINFLLLIKFILFKKIIRYFILIWCDNKMCLCVWGIGLLVVEMIKMVLFIWVVFVIMFFI